MSVPWTFDHEDYDLAGDMLPADWSAYMAKQDRRRALRKRIGKWAFRLTLAFIVIGNVYVWGSWR